MNLDERVETAILIKYYGKLLTEKQKNITSAPTISLSK